ncbi:diguanylate cyclase [Noviherbaspirillum sp. 17J57-3]|uniref:diguanylate cyclase n=2 Tax=Noviherbaspirillum galbum TaxID=2709383 RepID=A0A6B3SG98_9BURK|nr:diguanylate cyclase [Noviherbaspirillum galbum]
MLERHFKPTPAASPAPAAAQQAIVASTPAPQKASLPLVDDAPAPPLKSAGIPLVDPPAPVAMKSAGIPLVDVPVPEKTPGVLSALSVQPVAAQDAVPADKPDPALERLPRPPEAIVGESVQARLLRDLLVRTLTLGVASLLHKVPDLSQESEVLADAVRKAMSEKSLNDVSAKLKQFCFRIELKSADLAEEHELLLRLFKLLLENVSELLDNDSWLSGQIASVQALLDGPISHAALLDATRSLKDVIYKQGALKHSLAEAKSSMKTMMITFIDRLGAVAASTGEYHEKIDGYARQISSARGIPELNKILDNVMRDTRAAQVEALRSRDDMVAARQQVQFAEARIQQLESQLQEMSDLVREDQLTGSLNRRGLDDVFDRELARSDRRASPLCISLLDLDDFKRLNDTYGHVTGDQALIHLVRVVKDTLRSMDVIGRFGGEEFLIVLPDTPLPEAIQTVTRVQRELTKRIFLHNNERLLITFSAGVALRQPGEDQVSLVKRADDALYKAKRAGKNRVIAAD